MPSSQQKSSAPSTPTKLAKSSRRDCLLAYQMCKVFNKAAGRGRSPCKRYSLSVFFAGSRGHLLFLTGCSAFEIRLPETYKT